jgi:ferritin
MCGIDTLSVQSNSADNTMRIIHSLLLPHGALAFAPLQVKHQLSDTARCVATKPASDVSSDVQKLYGLFNAQITNEFSASHLYLAASIWCEDKEFVGMAGWMRSESNEERSHALSLIDFANKRDIPIELEDIPAPSPNWETLEDLWSDLLESEKGNTKSLYEVADAAQTAHDHAITTLLQPFHSEQVESEGQLKTILAKVREENLTPGLVYQLDTELGNALTK